MTGPDQRTALCVLGCADRTRTDVWPRPPRPRDPVGLLTCRPCADKIRTVLDEVFELAVVLALVSAAGSTPASGDGGRKRIKDEPVAPVPVSVPVAALTDIRSLRGAWVPDAEGVPGEQLVDDERPSVEELEQTAAAATRALDRALREHGPSSSAASIAATELSAVNAQLSAVRAPRRPPGRGVDPRDGAPTSVVGFLDRWTDQLRLGRGLLGAGTCRALVERPTPTGAGPRDAHLGLQPRYVECGRPTEYRRLVLGEMGARTTGLFAACAAGHIHRPAGQGDAPDLHTAVGHRPAPGVRHGLTLLAGVDLLKTHNDWICAQPWVADFWRDLRELRAELGRAHGEQRPSRIGICPNTTGDVDDDGQAVLCGNDLFASPYSDTIECPKCGRTWTHREWRFLGRTMGVIA